MPGPDTAKQNLHVIEFNDQGRLTMMDNGKRLRRGFYNPIMALRLSC